MEKIRNLSIRKTIILYMLVNLICCFFLTALLSQTAVRIQTQIWQKYADIAELSKMQKGIEEAYDIYAARPERERMESADWQISELCDFIETWCILIISSVGMIVTVFLFYRNKIKTPLAELKRSSKLIAENDLDFQVSYENQDEMGALCREFEKMRQNLSDSNRKLWNLVEQEKALRAAVSHDIRAPLTIIKGYQEMLLEMAEKDTMVAESVSDMVQAQIKQTSRLEAFLNKTQQLSCLEERGVERRENEMEAFAAQVEANSKLMGREHNISMSFSLETAEKTSRFDADLVMEVIENLVGNGLRYAKHTMDIKVWLEDSYLVVTVSDDGEGFQKDQQILTKPFYHANPRNDLTHFGLGLYLCKIYCEKHGGKLILENAKGGGAAASAFFHTGR